MPLLVSVVDLCARNCGPRAPRARRARTSRTPRPSRRAQRTSARPLVVSAPPAGPRAERRSGARAERRTRREKSKRRRDHRGACERPCSTAAARTTHGDARAPCASRACPPSPPAPSLRAERRPVEKARDEDDDRRPDGRRAREEDHRGAREWPCSIAVARTTHGSRRARVPRRDASTPLACSARSGDRRDDARQERRPATAKTNRMTPARHVPAEVRRREPPKRGVFVVQLTGE